MHLIGSAASQQEEDLRLTINNTYTGNSHTTVHEHVHNVTDLKELHVNNRKGTTDEFHNNVRDQKGSQHGCMTEWNIIEDWEQDIGMRTGIGM